MAEYIEKQAVLDEIDEDIQEFPECEYALKFVKRWIKKIPPADVRPVVRGRWIVHYDDIWPEESTQECPECHEEVSLLIDCKFCPNCGADMRGGDAE